MQKILCAVFDEKSGIYASPFTSINKDTARRDFRYVVTKDPSSDLYRNPIDYHLFQIADYDDNTGKLTENRALIVSALEFITEQEK